MNIISYCFFNNPTDFENCQKKTKYKIMGISPVVETMDIQNQYDYEYANNPTRKSSYGKYEHKIFVTYLKEEDYGNN